MNNEYINPDYLKQYDQGEKHEDINMGNTMISFMVEDSINKIEAQRWRGLDGELQNTELKDLLYRSDFVTERQVAANYFGVDGAVFIALILIDNQWYTQFFKISSYESFKTHITEMTADSLETRNLDGTRTTKLYYRWRIAGENEKRPGTGEDLTGRVIRETFYRDPMLKKEIIEETYIYPPKVKFVPGKIIRNNANAAPDWWRVTKILREIDVLSNEVGPEWEHIKTMWNSTGVFGKGTGANERRRQMENGERVFSDFSINAKYAQQFSAMMSGSTTLTTLIQSIAFHEDRALKYAFQGRDLEGSGTNKHGMQVGLFSQAHSEYITKKKSQRERDYIRFFKDIVEPITGIIAPNRIQIDDSAYEQGKKDALRQAEAQRQYNLAQATNQKAQAEKALEEAKLKAAQAGKTNKEKTLLKAQQNTPPAQQNNIQNNEKK